MGGSVQAGLFVASVASEYGHDALAQCHGHINSVLYTDQHEPIPIRYVVTRTTDLVLAFNWNILGDGEWELWFDAHHLGSERRFVTVVTMGQEFYTELNRMTVVPDFPEMDMTTTLIWNEALQNFIIYEVVDDLDDSLRD